MVYRLIARLRGDRLPELPPHMVYRLIARLRGDRPVRDPDPPRQRHHRQAKAGRQDEQADIGRVVFSQPAEEGRPGGRPRHRGHRVAEVVDGDQAGALGGGHGIEEQQGHRQLVTGPAAPGHHLHAHQVWHRVRWQPEQGEWNEGQRPGPQQAVRTDPRAQPADAGQRQRLGEEARGPHRHEGQVREPELPAHERGEVGTGTLAGEGEQPQERHQGCGPRTEQRGQPRDEPRC